MSNNDEDEEGVIMIERGESVTVCALDGPIATFKGMVLDVSAIGIRLETYRARVQGVEVPTRDKEFVIPWSNIALVRREPA